MITVHHIAAGLLGFIRVFQFTIIWYFVSVCFVSDAGGQIQSKMLISGVSFFFPGKRAAEPYERWGHRTAGPNSRRERRGLCENQWAFLCQPGMHRTSVCQLFGLISLLMHQKRGCTCYQRSGNQAWCRENHNKVQKAPIILRTLKMPKNVSLQQRSLYKQLCAANPKNV